MFLGGMDRSGQPIREHTPGHHGSATPQKLPPRNIASIHTLVCHLFTLSQKAKQDSSKTNATDCISFPSPAKLGRLRETMGL